MMIEKKTIIDQIEITRSGHIQVRFGLLLVEDGSEISCQWHRTTIEPGGDVDAAIATINANLTMHGTSRAKPVDTERVPLIKSICQLVHTPDIVAAYRERINKNG